MSQEPDRAKTRRLETLLRTETDRIQGPTGESAAIRVALADTDLEIVYWLWPQPNSLEGWQGREVVGDAVRDVAIDFEQVAHLVGGGTARRRQRVEAPPADCERFGARASTPSRTTSTQGDPGRLGMEW